MKIAFNPSTVAALIAPPNNKDITFDLRGRNIFARGVKFCGTDTNTWRDIKVNNVSIDSNILDLRNGSNTTLINTDGVVTINSTWRPVVDNLTSDSTTSSLSANLGRVLAGLINGKSDLEHTHDDRYLRLTGGTMSGLISSSYSVGTLIEGCTNAILKATADGYNSLICAPIKSGNISISAWTAEDNLNFGYAKKGKTENSFDTRMYWDATNNNLHAAAFTGHLYGTADNAVNSDTTDGVHLEWAGELRVNDYTWLAGWTNDGEKIKAVNKNLFATSGHNHDGRYVYNYGDTTNVNGLALNQNALFMSTTSGITEDWWHILQASWNDEYRWNSLIAFPTLNRNGMYYRSGLDDNTKWGAWVKLLDVNNYSSTLDSRYYTESEINSFLDAKLNRQNLSYGTWNPRGYNLAADYLYNGGDLSISESGGLIHVSVNGYFWLNEGQYRVLDTSDIYDIRSSITILLYLSNSDTNLYPLIWGGDDHRNIYTSTGGIYKSHDKLSWLTSSLTLYATHLQTTSIDFENSRGIFLVTSGGTSPYNGIRLPDLQSNSIGIFSRVGNGGDEGGIVLSEDTCIIYNSFDTGWGLSVRYKDINLTDISGDNTIAFGIRQDYRAYSLGGFEKSGSDNSYVLLGGGGHKALSDFAMASNFVRAGVYDSADLNKLDTYSFIKSVNSTVASTSPKGNTGWYNVILAVHKNGNDDGPNYIGQIALGMTTNTNDMFFRGRRTDSWKTVIHSGNIGNQTVANAYHLRINSADTWSTWYWVGLSDLPSWLWGSNDGTNMYVWDPSNFRVAYATSADSANKLNKWFDSRVADLNLLFEDGSLRIFHATSSTTANKCPSDATVLHLAWDNNEGLDSLLAVGPSQNTLYFRGLNNYKWNSWQTVLHDGNSSISGNTIKINNTSLTVANSNHNHDNVYLKLAGGTMLDLSRIGVNGDLYIGDANNSGWLYFQDIASLDGAEYWSISTDGSAEFEDISTRSDVNVGGLIYRDGIDSYWHKGRDNALLRDTSSIGYHTLWSLKTIDGSWDFGEYNISGWSNIPMLSYITDSNYNSGNNEVTYQIKFPLASGTVALTSNIPNPTNYYWADVKISSTANSMTLPLFYSVKAYQYNLTNANGSESYNLAYLYNNIINIGSNSLIMHINASNILFYANSTQCIDINTQGHIGIGKTASLSALLTVASITELTTLKLLVDGAFRKQPVCVACGKVIDPISSTNINVYGSLNITATYTNNHYRINLANLRSSMISQNNVYAQITPITKYVSYRTEAIKDGSYIYLDVYCNARTSFYFCVWVY